MTILTPAKQAVHSLFSLAGLEVHKKRPPEPVAPPPRDTMTGALNHLWKLGLRPRTVIDAGVATQTNDLYQHFKESELLLIEPLAEFEPFLKRICSTYGAQYILAAAGETDGTVVFNVHADGFGSSLLHEVEGGSVDGTPREVPMVAIDSACEKRSLAGPYVIKLDVQGAELQVLAGARRVLRETEAVILEVSLFGSMIGGPQFYDVISRMKELGFVVYDISGLVYRPLDGALSQLDMVFVQENGRFRGSHAWATPEQRKELLKLHQAFIEQERARVRAPLGARR